VVGLPNLLLRVLFSAARSHHDLVLENLVLHHQLEVVGGKSPTRPCRSTFAPPQLDSRARRLVPAALYIQSEARQDIAFHLPGGQMSEVLPSQKSDRLSILIRAALVGMLVQPETVPTEGSDEFVCPTG
jgi:hypothetical protein